MTREALEVSPKIIRLHLKPSEKLSDIESSFQGLLDIGYLSEYIDTFNQEISRNITQFLFQDMKKKLTADINLSNPNIPTFNLNFLSYQEPFSESFLHPQRGIIFNF